MFCAKVVCLQRLGLFLTSPACGGGRRALARRWGLYPRVIVLREPPPRPSPARAGEGEERRLVSQNANGPTRCGMGPLLFLVVSSNYPSGLQAETRAGSSTMEK